MFEILLKERFFYSWLKIESPNLNSERQNKRNELPNYFLCNFSFSLLFPALATRPKSGKYNSKQETGKATQHSNCCSIYFRLGSL